MSNLQDDGAAGILPAPFPPPVGRVGRGEGEKTESYALSSRWLAGRRRGPRGPIARRNGPQNTHKAGPRAPGRIIRALCLDSASFISPRYCTRCCTNSICVLGLVRAWVCLSVCLHAWACLSVCVLELAAEEFSSQGQCFPISPAMAAITAISTISDRR